MSVMANEVMVEAWMSVSTNRNSCTGVVCEYRSLNDRITTADNLDTGFLHPANSYV